MSWWDQEPVVGYAGEEEIPMYLKYAIGKQASDSDSSTG